MAKTKIIISLDTEDFTQNRSCDAIFTLAKLFTQEGVRANFCVVGLLAKQLQKWGRTDVIGALKAHEIAFHTYGHSLHPMVDEYTDICDYRKAEKACMEQEALGMQLVKSALGADKLYACVTPGNAQSYVAGYAYPKLGVPIFCDTVCDTPDGRGVFYCNALHMNYTASFEGLFWANDYNPEEFLNGLARRKHAILYTHPNILVYRDFWDVLNYDKENLRPFGDWLEGMPRGEKEIELYLSRLRDLIRRIKADSRFEFANYSDIAKARGVYKTRILRRAQIHEIRTALNREFGPVELGGDSFCIADIFAACRAFLAGEDAYACGAAYGFLDAPTGIDAPAAFAPEDIRRAAAAVDTAFFFPASVTIGNARAGCADLLFAMLDLLCRPETDAPVRARPRAQLNSTECMPNLQTFSTAGTWRHSDAFKDAYQSKRLKLQGWTLRF